MIWLTLAHDASLATRPVSSEYGLRHVIAWLFGCAPAHSHFDVTHRAQNVWLVRHTNDQLVRQDLQSVYADPYPSSVAPHSPLGRQITAAMGRVRVAGSFRHIGGDVRSSIWLPVR